MDEQLGALVSGKYAAGLASQPRQMTVTENLEARRSGLEAQLERVNAALDALKKNPDLENALNLIQQASY